MREMLRAPTWSFGSKVNTPSLILLNPPLNISKADFYMNKENYHTLTYTIYRICEGVVILPRYGYLRCLYDISYNFYF